MGKRFNNRTSRNVGNDLLNFLRAVGTKTVVQVYDLMFKELVFLWFHGPRLYAMIMGARINPCFFLSGLFLYVSLDTCLSIGTGTLSIGESISGDQTIVSEGNGNFELGFFTPDNKSNNYYIGIWYRKISERTVVWVANRDKPLSDKNYSQLKLLENGNLVILDSMDTINIWSTNLISTSSSNSTEAALLESGNLVLRNVSNSSELIWESFDHPTDTLLPGGKFGLNKLRANTSSASPHGRIQWIPLRGSTLSKLILMESIGFSPRKATDYSKNLSDWSGGCVRNTPLQCVGNAASVKGEEEDGFLKMSNMRLPMNPQSVAIGSSLQACEVACLNSCSCNAYAFDGNNCSVWKGDLLNLEQLSDGDTGRGDLYLKLAASELSNSTSSGGGNKKGSVTTRAIVGAVSGVVALLGLLVVLIWTKQRRDLVGTLKLVEGYLVPFSYRDLRIATKSFSRKLGKGGFGSVFKGTLSESTIVPVKKLEGLSQGEKQFRAEVSTIGMIQHVNLVRLRGFCCQGTERLLVYDFMPNGSLDSHLFHKKKDSGDKVLLDWKTRYQIALGTARGLAYLHEKCRECIIHCDIKPENILLDAEFCPKVADFGLAKLLGRDFRRVLTTMRGTIGYLAPEWISGVAITAKADVYSYGMMLFELISGKRNSNQSASEKFRFFPIWAASKINEDGEILSFLDYRLEGNVDLAELETACKVASWCIQDDEVHRPSMGLVVQILEGIVEVSTPPIPRNLQNLVETDHESIVFFPEPSSSQSSQARSPTSDT
ncbi:G-type lectin S-receptor-like serine/threonine-protein kinase At2g19130 [Telopea speciosissima]|uniref:G-type lectin S-receptor-like serine/threonine-protein kinase At2g19130 n=1 Tax=Telopea speciosissima TaxID=54955 RepID=UPI001CC4E1FC|nr:G-type lectin S-receptor-like serine/threonine-protein kinase At2g19130 [Telopea speciosissima]